ncbi:MAG: tetratricopeptide repeat protein [Candidatus Omnitrophica bacterium]|nr:tetratricopeptide repeat protein [Candidatus Omnitrophota bacterium]
MNKFIIRRYFFKFCLLTTLVCSPHLGFAQSSETDLLSAAQQAFNDGFNDVAKRYLEDFLDKYPQSLDLSKAKLLLGQCDFLRGEYAKALDLFEELSQETNKRDEILYWRGETYLKQNRLVEAQRDYQSVINDFPQSAYVPQAYYSLGWSFFQKKEFQRARTEFSHLTARFPNHQLSEDATLKIAECDYNTGRLKNAIKDFRRLEVKYPKSTHLCEADFNTAESFYYLNQFGFAVEYYQTTIDLPCDDNLKLAAYTAEGWSYIKLSKFNNAQNVLKKAETFGKAKGLSLQEVVLAQANLAYSIGAYDKALILFSDFIGTYPQSSHWIQGYLGRANVFYLLKKYEEARMDYLHLEGQKEPDIFVKCRFGLGWCELKLGHQAEAISRFQEVFEHSRDVEARANALIQMGDVYQESNQWDNAAGMYERVRKMYPNNAMMDYVLYRQAIAFLKSGKIDASLVNFKSLRDGFSDSKYLEDINYYMGVISFKKGDWRQSAQTMSLYLKSLTHPSEFTPEANYILALSRLNLKQPEDALGVFQKILRLYPNDINIAKNADIGIAKCQFELGQDREAVKRFKIIAYKYPNTEEAFESLLWLAQHYLKNADADSAIEYYKLITDEFPESPQIDQIHYELGQAYEIQGKSDEALEQYKAISGRDELLKGKTMLAIAGIMSKDMDPHRAIAAYESIIATSADHAGEAYLKLGQLYRNTQDYEKEVEVYQKALASRQGQIDRAQVQFNLADTLELMSRTEDAIAEYLKIPDLYPNKQAWVVKAYLRVAKIYEEGEDWQGARVTYQKIIQLKTPEATFAQERLDWIKNNAGKMR